MTLFISWPKSQDEAFRSAYELRTMETVQETPEDLGDRWRIGTSRATADDVDAIIGQGIDAAYGDGNVG